MTRAPSFLLLLVALLASVAYGIFEDQAGEFDWSVTQLGRVTTVASQGQGRHASVVRGTSRAVYVGTDERSRAIARLDAKTGAIKWRRVLHEGTMPLVGLHWGREKRTDPFNQATALTPCSSPTLA